MSSESIPGRRAFLGTVTAATGLAAAGPLLPLLPAEARDAPADGKWDLSWIDGLRGKHKQVFDFGGLDGRTSPLHVIRNYLEAHREVFGLEYPRINTVAAIAFAAFPINATDPIWEKYSLGEKWKVKDPLTKEWSRRNVYTGLSPDDPGYPDTVPALRALGTIFWQCNNALNGISRWFAGEAKTSEVSMRAELEAGLMPGVRIVPAHTMAIGLVQERGCTYEKL